GLGCLSNVCAGYRFLDFRNEREPFRTTRSVLPLSANLQQFVNAWRSSHGSRSTATTLEPLLISLGIDWKEAPFNTAPIVGQNPAPCACSANGSINSEYQVRSNPPKGDIWSSGTALLSAAPSSSTHGGK